MGTRPFRPTGRAEGLRVAGELRPGDHPAAILYSRGDRETCLVAGGVQPLEAAGRRRGDGPVRLGFVLDSTLAWSSSRGSANRPEPESPSPAGQIDCTGGKAGCPLSL